MWVMLFSALLLSATITLSGAWDSVRQELPGGQESAMHELDKYRAFTYAVTRYMDANPTANGQVTWAMIAASPTTPPGGRRAIISDSWYAQADGSGGYVICAQLSERTISALEQMMPDGVKLHGVGDAGNINSKLVFAEDATEAGAEGLKCTG